MDTALVIFALAGGFVLSAAAVAFAAVRPAFILYALAAVVSLVGINIHLGVTLYLSRLVIIVFLASILIRTAMGERACLSRSIVPPFAMLFGLILANQLVSVLFSAHLLDGLRQVFIYLSLMVLFTTVVVVGTSVEAITRAVKIYLVVGLIQGLYGMYQLIGGRFGWPTYQSLMVGIPVANDKTLESGGYVYSSALEAFRPNGFFPADVSHYAMFLASVLVLALALLIHNRRSLFLYVVLIVDTLSLLASLSRSGLLALILFGIPSLLFLVWRVRPTVGRLYSHILKPFLRVVMVGVVVVPLLLIYLETDVIDTFARIASRMSDLVDWGENPKESASLHILTRLLALDAFSSSPLIGVGLGVNASNWYSEYFQSAWGGAHSHHLDSLGQTGLIGAGLEWLFMGLVARYMWRGLFVRRGNSPERIMLAGLLAAFVLIVLGNLLYHFYLLDFVWFLMGCGVALSRAMILDAQGKGTIVAPLDSSTGSSQDGNSTAWRPLSPSR